MVRTFFKEYLDARLYDRRHHNGVQPGVGGGYVIHALGYRSLFLTGASLIAAATLLFWAYVRAPRGELARYAAADTAR